MLHALPNPDGVTKRFRAIANSKVRSRGLARARASGVMPTPRRRLQNQSRMRICRVLRPTVGEEDIDMHEFKTSVCMRLDVAIALYLATFQYHRDFGGRDRVWNEKKCIASRVARPLSQC